MMYLPINELWNIDGVEGLEALPPDSTPFALTSPPFDDTFKYGGHTWDENVWQAMIRELWRVITPGGVVAWQVRGKIRDGNESDTPERQIEAFRNVGFRKYETIYSATTRTRSNPGHHFRTVTPVYIFTKNRPITINLRTQKNKYAGQVRGRSFRRPDGTYHLLPRMAVAEVGIKSDLWYYPPGLGKTTKDAYAFKHASLMPEKLARDLILTYSSPGDLVLDPMGGSGTTAKMALLNDRNYLSFEIWEERHLIAERRLREAHRERRRQLRAFFNF